MMIDQELFNVAVEDEDGFASTIVQLQPDDEADDDTEKAKKKDKKKDKKKKKQDKAAGDGDSRSRAGGERVPVSLRAREAGERGAPAQRLRPSQHGFLSPASRALFGLNEPHPQFGDAFASPTGG